MGGGFRGLCDTKHPRPPQLRVPTEAQEPTRWRQTQNVQRDGTGECKIVLNGKMLFSLPFPDQHRI